MIEYIELAKKCGMSVGSAKTIEGKLCYYITEDQLTAYSEALRAKDKEEIANLRLVAIDNKDWFDVLKIDFDKQKEELAATQLVVEQMREALLAQRELDYTQSGKVTGPMIERVAELEKDAKRYRRIRILGAAVGETKQLAQGTVLRFQSLDGLLDKDISVFPSRGEFDAAIAKEQGK